MKRSRIFLGVTTCLLAIASVAAAKAHRFTTTAYYFSAAGSTHCKTFNTACVSGTVATCVTTISNHGVPGNYTIYTAAGCANKFIRQ